jgi:adenine-specific DNA methylase
MYGSSHVIDFDAVPTTRYQGSKRKLLPWIHSHLEHIGFDSAVDVFGGTGAVSYLLKKMGKSVTYNDVLKFNYVIGSAIIANDRVILTPEEIHFLTEPVRSLNAQGTIARYFPGFFFTDHENRWLDHIVAKIRSCFGGTPVTSLKRHLALYALFQTCLSKRPFNLFHRKNLHLRMANVHRTFGNKTTWDRPIRLTFRSFLNEANNIVFSGERKCRALNLDASEIPRGHHDLAYIDPPYLLKAAKNETADYRRVYHFLEGLVDYERWPDLIDFSTTNRRLKVKRQNGWLRKETNSELFDQLFDRFEDSVIVVSYKRYGIPSVETIIRSLKRRARRVHCYTTQYSYALNHQNGEAKRNRECLIIAE